MNKKLMIVIIVVVLMCAYYCIPRAPVGGKYTVYGTNWCGYTTKQREYLNSKYGKASHTYVDCESQNCPGMKGFPVTITPGGQRVEGFNQTI